MDKRMQSVVANFQGEKEDIIPLLQSVQEEYGYLSEDALLDIARVTGVSESKIYGIATFYSQFRFTPIGKNRILVCRGTACHVKGVTEILEQIERELEITDGETTSDGLFSLETAACIGCCSLAPVLMINEKTYGKVTQKKVKEIIKQYRQEEQE